MLNAVGQVCGAARGCAEVPLVKLEFLTEETVYRGKHSSPTAEYPPAVDGSANGKLCGVAALNHKRRRLGGDQQESLADELGMYSGRLPVPPVCTPAADHHQRGARIGRSFLTIRHNASVFHTEDWKPRGCTMYLPLAQDVMINMRCIDQVSFESDQFFLADGKGNYIGAKSGHAIHLWRYDHSTKRLFISQSVLFLREQEDVEYGQPLPASTTAWRLTSGSRVCCMSTVTVGTVECAITVVGFMFVFATLCTGSSKHAPSNDAAVGSDALYNGIDLVWCYCAWL
nr:uncharacterized protein LOC126517480 isoform X3 [Dermacentor andersoni]